jgi:hypothetical protein
VPRSGVVTSAGAMRTESGATVPGRMECAWRVVERFESEARLNRLFL